MPTVIEIVNAARSQAETEKSPFRRWADQNPEDLVILLKAFAQSEREGIPRGVFFQVARSMLNIRIDIPQLTVEVVSYIAEIRQAGKNAQRG